MSTPSETGLLTRDEFEKVVADVLQVERKTLTGDADLLEFGLDSIRAMFLVDKWQRIGIDVQFLELAENSTLDAWWRVIETKQ